jgi:hypothetical protein
METLPFATDDLEQVAEPFRTLYAEGEDGKYRLKVEGAPDPKALDELQENLAKERNQTEAFKRQLKKFKDIDPDRYQQLLKQQQEAERRKAEEEGNFKAVEQQLRELHEQERRGDQERITHLSKAVEGLLVDAQATAAIAKYDGEPELLLPHVKRYVRVVEENGQFVPRVVDGAGNPRIGDSKGTPMSIAQLVEEMKASPVFGRAFKGGGQSGGGMPPNGQPGAKPGAPSASGGSAGTPPVGFTRTYSAEEKVQLQQRVGSEAYRDLVTRDLRAQQAARQQHGTGQGLPARGG